MRVRFLCALAVVAGLSVPVMAQTVPSPSVWRLNVAASEFGSEPAPKVEELTVVKNTPSALRWKMHEVGSDGTTHEMSWSGAPDGKARPVTGGAPGEMASFSGNTMHFVEPDGSVSNGSYTLSSDGKVWTHTWTDTTKDGHAEKRKMVFDRVR